MQAKNKRSIAELRQQMMDNVIVPGMDRLVGIMLDPNASDADVARVVFAAMDRIGMGPSASLTVQVEAPTAEAIMAAEQELDALMEKARENRAEAIRRFGGWKCPGCGEFCCEPPEPGAIEAAIPAEGDGELIVDAELIDEPLAEVVPFDRTNAAGPTLLSPDA